MNACVFLVEKRKKEKSLVFSIYYGTLNYTLGILALCFTKNKIILSPNT
jgi:hypothetical protein